MTIFAAHDGIQRGISFGAIRGGSAIAPYRVIRIPPSRIPLRSNRPTLAKSGGIGHPVRDVCCRVVAVASYKTLATGLQTPSRLFTYPGLLRSGESPRPSHRRQPPAEQGECAGFWHIASRCKGNQLHTISVAMIGANLERINAKGRGTAGFGEELEVARGR